MDIKKKLPFEKSHAYIIAINDYQHLEPLENALNDGETLGEILTEKQHFDNVRLYFNAGKQQIETLFSKTILQEVKEKDRVLVYFAGHGLTFKDEDNKSFGYIMPVEATENDIDSGISMEFIRTGIDKLSCKHVLLILDCCFSGSFKWTNIYRFVNGFTPKRIYRERFYRYVDDIARQVITSSTHDQLVLDLDISKKTSSGMPAAGGRQHSPFAQTLFDGLNGAADIVPDDGGDGLITATELFVYLRQEVEAKAMLYNENSRQTPRLFTLPRHNKGEFIFFHPTHRLNLPPTPRGEPYKGLRTFEENDKDYLYGRDVVIQELTEQLKRHNFIVITGASRSGKSSLIKAGLIPRLKEEQYTLLPIIEPGASSAPTLDPALAHTMEMEMGDKNLLLVDQYEELFLLCKDKNRGERFIQSLSRLLRLNQTKNLKIIITLRADFITQFKEQFIKEDYQPQFYPIPRLTVDQLREVIEKPALQDLLFFEPDDLGEQLIHDVSHAPGALPLLSLTLAKLYSLSIENHRQRMLHREDYKNLGGAVGVLCAQAQTIYDGLDPLLIPTMKNIMMRLATMKDGQITSKRVMAHELEFPRQEENHRVNTILKELDTQGLIIYDTTVDGQPCIEISHHGFLSKWEPLSQWVEGDPENVMLMSRLSEAVNRNQLWHKHPALDDLHRQLQQPDCFLNLREKRFIEKSLQHRAEIKLKRKRIITSVSISLLILVAIAVYLFMMAQQEARIARANDLIAQAQDQTADGKPLHALTLARQAYYLDKNPNVMQALGQAAALTLKRPISNAVIHHKHFVNDALFSPTGENVILSISSDNTAKLSDFHGRLIASLQHECGVHFARFFPGGRILLTLSLEKTARLWDTKGQLLQRFNHPLPVTTAAISPQGNYLLTASQDKSVRLWTPQGKLLKIYDFTYYIVSLDFSPTVNRFVAVSVNKNGWLMDLEGRVLNRFDKLHHARFSVTGKYLLAPAVNTVKLWNLHNKRLTVFNTPSISFAALSPHEDLLLIASSTGTVKLWNLDRTLQAQLNGHDDTVVYAQFSADGKPILTASRDHTAKMWDLSGNLLADLSLHGKDIRSVAFSADGSRLLTASMDNTARLWDLKDQPLVQLVKPKQKLHGLRISPDGFMFLAITQDNTVKIWNMRGRLKGHLKKHTKLINSALFSPDSSSVLTASADNTAILWDIKGKVKAVFTGHRDNVNTAVFSPGGSKIATASYDQTAKIWNLQGQCLLTLQKHTGRVNRALFSPNGNKILTASADRTARMWNINGQLVTEFDVHSEDVRQAIFTPDGTAVLTLAGGTNLWALDGSHITRFDDLSSHNQSHKIDIDNRIIDAEFSPDGKRLLVYTHNGEAWLMDLPGGILCRFIHREAINTARFSSDGTRVLTASQDRTLKLWDLQGNLLANYDDYNGSVNHALFTLNGKQILSLSSDHTVKLRYTPRGIVTWLDKTLPTEKISKQKKQ